MVIFRDAIDVCGLRDLGYVGSKFTWRYIKRDGTQIRERIDRALASTTWSNLFPSAIVFHLSNSTSDHSQLSIHLDMRLMQRRSRRKLFRFEAMWLKDESCEKVVLEVWEDGLLSKVEFPFLKCMDLCRDRLVSWNKNEFGHVQTKINSLQQHPQWHEKQQSNLELVQETCRIRAELNELLDREEAMWSRRSHITWL